MGMPWEDEAQAAPAAAAPTQAPVEQGPWEEPAPVAPEAPVYKEPDMAGMKAHIGENFKKSAFPMNSEAPEGKGLQSLPGDVPTVAIPPPPSKVEGEAPGPAPHEAKTLFDAVEAGLQMSVAGLALHGKPTEVMGGDADMFMRIASQLGTLAPDLPIMALGGLLGGVGGGTAGTAIAPGPGTVAGVVLGTGAGSFALPTALRTMMMQHYEKGDMHTFKDFWERTATTFLETSKSATIGAMTMGVGGVAGKVVAGVASPLVRTAAVSMSEIGTMVSVGAALEGHMPNSQDFVDGALVVGALHGIGTVTPKLREIYAKTGLKPEQVVEHADTDPTVKQDLLSVNKTIPDTYQKMADPSAPTVIDGHLVQPSELHQADIPNSGAGQLHEGHAPGFEQPIDRVKVEAREEPKPFEPKEIETTGDDGVVKKEIDPVDQARLTIRNQLVESPEGKNSISRAIESARSSLEDASWSGVKESAKQNFDTFYTKYMDKFDPIKRAVNELSQGKSLGAASDAYKLARMANDAKSKARYAFEFGTMDFKTLAKSGESLKQILTPLKESLPEFNDYLVAKRIVELESRGIKAMGKESDHATILDSAKKLVDADAAKFDAPAKALTEFQNRNLEYLRDSGMLSKEAFEKITKENTAFVPFKRLIEEGENKGGSSKSAPVKKIRGSDRKILNPMESIAENTAFFMELAEKNRATTALVDMQLRASKEGGPQLITKVRTPMEGVKVSAEESAKAIDFEKLGIDPAEHPEIAEHLTESMKDTTIFRPKKVPLSDNQFELYRDGKREVYETDTPGLAEAVKKMDGEPAASNILFKIATAASGSLRLSLSLTPDFILRNFFRDQITASSFSKNSRGILNAVDTIGALGELMKSKENNIAYQEWLKSGGAGGAFLEFDKSYLQNDVFELSKKTGLIDKTFNVLSKPIHYMKLAGELSEQSTRFAEFKKSTKGDYSKDSLMQGGFDAREVTVDFQRIGSQMSALNAITAFQNVAIQGIDRAARAAIENPKGLAMSALGGITVPSMLLWMHNKDDKRYQDLPRWQKDLYWIIPTNDWVKPEANDSLEAYRDQGLLRMDKNGIPEINKGVIYRLPKPQELGLIFGSLPERVADQFIQHNPDAMKDFMGTVGGMLVPSVVPTIAAAPLETWANKSIFTGAPIVPASAEKLLPEYRYTDYTSETAKKISSLVARVPNMKTNAPAPAVIDNWVQSWSGNLGKYALQTLDAGLVATGNASVKEKPANTWADVPFVKAFIVRNPSSGMQPILDFRAKFDEHQQVIDTIKSLTKQGDFESAKREYFLSENQDKLVSLQSSQTAITNLGKSIKMVYSSPGMKPDEKRQQIDGMYYMMNTIAKSQLKVMDQMSEQIKKYNFDQDKGKGSK